MWGLKEIPALFRECKVDAFPMLVIESAEMAGRGGVTGQTIPDLWKE
jgi:hypothetical protein